MAVEQIFGLVNDIAEQSNGMIPVATADTSSLVAMGNAVLNTNATVEYFLNSISQRINANIIRFRRYPSKFDTLAWDDIKWGAAARKIDIEVPDFEESEVYKLQNGQSIDPWVVNKPKARQKIFIKETPYVLPLTIQRELLKRAFTSAGELESFISGVMGESQNKLTKALDNLARLSICNMIMSTTKVFDLVTIYNNLTGNTITTGTDSLNDADFLRWSVGFMNLISRKMSDASVDYNAEGQDRFTPFENQIMYILADYEVALQTKALSTTYNDKYVQLRKNETVSFWQGSKDPYAVRAKAELPQRTEEDNIIAVLFDEWALGTYRRETDVLTTPVNARAKYYNVFWHANQLWFNDLQENFVYFTLN